MIEGIFISVLSGCKGLWTNAKYLDNVQGIVMLALSCVGPVLKQNVNTFVITARACTRCLADDAWARRPGIRSWLAGWGLRARMELQMLLLRTVTWTALLRARASHWLPSWS